MSFGDPDFRPNKATSRQQITQNAEKIRLSFKMRCKSCDARLVKASYYVDKPIDPRIQEVYDGFYSVDHYCKECSDVQNIAPPPRLEHLGAQRFRGRGG